jgi:hypothetical protein
MGQESFDDATTDDKNYLALRSLIGLTSPGSSAGHA